MFPLQVLHNEENSVSNTSPSIMNRRCSLDYTSLVPRPHRHHACEEKGLGTLERFLGLAHHHVTARAPVQTYANNHMIAELAEPRIGTNVPRPFPRVRGGVWERDYDYTEISGHFKFTFAKTIN